MDERINMSKNISTEDIYAGLGAITSAVLYSFMVFGISQFCNVSSHSS